KSLQKQLQEQKEQIEKLKKQLQYHVAVPSIPTVTNNICDFKSSSQTNIYNESSTPELNYDILIDLFKSSYT
uniref:Uncharacterized protein n=1 Tax=Amphimedon queenslandica TaxID=400682 RepID=A0A1X7SN27_AMPQE